MKGYENSRDYRVVIEKQRAPMRDEVIFTYIEHCPKGNQLSAI